MSSGSASTWIAAVALVVSLASAGWSVYGFVLSSEIETLPLEEIVFLSEDGVPQITAEVTLANLAYGDYDDIARRQQIEIESDTGRLVFVARRVVSLGLTQPDASGTYPAPSPPCYVGGVGLVVCPVADTPILALEAGSITNVTPIFELADTDCGLDDCRNAQVSDVARILSGRVQVTYAVTSFRDNVHAISCSFDTTDEQRNYFTNIAGWFHPRCLSVAGD